MKRTDTVANPGGVVPYGPYNSGEDLDEVVGHGRAWPPRAGKECVIIYSLVRAACLMQSV